MERTREQIDAKKTALEIRAEDFDLHAGSRVKSHEAPRELASGRKLFSAAEARETTRARQDPDAPALQGR